MLRALLELVLVLQVLQVEGALPSRCRPLNQHRPILPVKATLH
jgi:hypothetical protein